MPRAIPTATTIARAPSASEVAHFEEELSTSFDALFPVGECPPRLREASRIALLGGGHRVRPSLCRAVARATGDTNPALASAYAVAIEMAHAASLVHDDLPSFDDASTRRGRPSIHAAYGVAVAILVGDGLLVAAFDAIGRTADTGHDRVAPATRILAGALGGGRGLVAGQAWESEPKIDIDRYHHAKTGALFEAAACLGALASGRDPEDFRALGRHVGLAYQIADDLVDATGTSAEKTHGRDAALGRPNAAHALGETLARAKLERLREETRLTIPAYADREQLVAWLSDLAASLDRR